MPNRTPLTHAISSDLSGEAYVVVNGVWIWLEEKFGLKAARLAVHPHISYVVGDCHDVEPLADRIGGLVADLEPVPVRLEGVAAFELERPVVYLAVRGQERLAGLHARLAELAQRNGLDVWPYYTPAQWVPHVTVALQDLEPGRLPEVMAALRELPLQLKSTLRSIELVRVGLEKHQYLRRFDLGHGRERRR